MAVEKYSVAPKLISKAGKQREFLVDMTVVCISQKLWFSLIYLSDVTEIAWSKDDRYLASVAMDGCFMVHDTQTFERIIKISGHDSSIKGLGFDPSGHFLATASDDRSLKIWRTSDWGLQASITDPFEDSPRAFVRRLS